MSAILIWSEAKPFLCCCLAVRAGDQEVCMTPACPLCHLRLVPHEPMHAWEFRRKLQISQFAIECYSLGKKSQNNSPLNSVLRLIKKIYQGFSVPWRDPKILRASGKSVGSTTYLNIKAQLEVTASLHTSTCLLPCVRASTKVTVCILIVICHTFYPTD